MAGSEMAKCISFKDVFFKDQCAQRTTMAGRSRVEQIETPWPIRHGTKPDLNIGESSFHHLVQPWKSTIYVCVS